MRYWILLIPLFITACAPVHKVKSGFDNTYLLWTPEKEIEGTQTPRGFIVTPQEVKSILPISKLQIWIYADSNNYYIIDGNSIFGKVVRDTVTNSYAAKKNGIRISGKDRGAINELLLKFPKPGFHKLRDIRVIAQKYY